jgi:hypothetical protein
MAFYVAGMKNEYPQPKFTDCPEGRESVKIPTPTGSPGNDRSRGSAAIGRHGSPGNK